jgi:threonine dehydrogenase-like Zn-dependent dehydrogenase
VPFGDVNLLKVPKTLPDEKALFLSDVACTSFHAAIDLGQVKRGESVAIWGMGPIGILTAKWCQLYGARDIFVIDEVKERLDLVRSKVPGVHVLNFRELEGKKLTDELERLCPGGVDVSIECAGFRYAKSITHKVERALMLETDSPDILNEMIYVTRLYGRMVLIADYLGFVNGFNIGGLMEKHIYLSGGQCPVQAVWHRVLDHIEKGEFDPSIMVTHFGKLSEAPEFYKKFHHKQDGVVKVFLRPEFEGHAKGVETYAKEVDIHKGV